MSPTMHAPRRKTCQALLPDGTTPCSASFRGWGRYCLAHLDECAQLSGVHKDAAARADRARRTGELSERQVRALAAGTNVGAVERAAEKVLAYQRLLEDEERARAALLARFPVESECSLSLSWSGALVCMRCDGVDGTGVCWHRGREARDAHEAGRGKEGGVRCAARAAAAGQGGG